MADPDLLYVEERGQLRPAREDERTVLISGDSLPVRRMEERADGVRV
jgi:nitrite reductase (NADH) large subunit